MLLNETTASVVVEPGSYAAITQSALTRSIELISENSAPVTRRSVAIRHINGILVCGGGPVGLTAACLLRERGHSVTVLERSSRDQLATSTLEDPSFNVTLVTRSMELLAKIGAAAADLAIEVDARQFWHAEGHVTVHPYGRRNTDRLYSIPRHDLVRRLVDRAERLGVKIEYSTSIVSLDAKRGGLTTESENGEISHITTDRAIVSDGSNSRLRHDMARQADTSYERRPDGYVYATLKIDAEAVASAGLSLNRIHFVPGDVGIDIALPNKKGSLSVLLERVDPGNLHNYSDFNRLDLFTRGCPDALRRHVTNLEDQLRSSPIRRFKYVNCGCWSLGRAILIGDAARCNPPYTGLGLNGGLHDVASFDAALAATDGDWTRAATLFEVERREHTRRVKELTEQHGRILHTGQFGGRRWRALDRSQRLAERLFGFRSAYQRVVFDAVFPDIRSLLRIDARLKAKAPDLYADGLAPGHA